MKFLKLGFLLLGYAVYSSVAQAMPISNVSTIRITSTNNTWLQISEVVALDGSSNDLALTSAGATTNSSGVGFVGPEALAVNGIAPGFCSSSSNCSPPGGNGLYHSNSPTGAFFEVILPTPSEIFSLSIFGRTDGFSFRDVYDVQLLDGNSNILFSATGQSADNTSHEAVVIFNPTVTPMPIPASFWLVGFGLFGIRILSRRRY